jgi:hypothetical protein
MMNGSGGYEMSLYFDDPEFGRKFTCVAQQLSLPKHEGESIVHPDLIPFPEDPNQVLMSYTPEHPKQAENMCLVRSGKNDLLNWSEDLWQNPVISYHPDVPWKKNFVADFCLLYIPELSLKWWTWFQPSGIDSCQIALGTSEDGVIWRDDYPENPVLKGGNGEKSWEYPYVRGPSVLWNRHTLRFEMFYDNFERSHGISDRICRAESTDGIHWEKRAIIYEPVETDEVVYAFHSCVRYFDGYYWCWFPRRQAGLWMMGSKTGLPGSWLTPVQVMEPEATGGHSSYRVGVLIDKQYRLHMMASYIHKSEQDQERYDIGYWISELSANGKKLREELQYQVADYDYGGSIIQPVH